MRSLTLSHDSTLAIEQRIAGNPKSIYSGFVAVLVLLLLFLVGVFSGCSSHVANSDPNRIEQVNAQSSMQTTNPLPSQTLPVETVDRLQALFSKVRQTGIARQELMHADFQKLGSSVNPEGFADAVLSWEGTSQLLEDEFLRRGWVLEKYFEHMLSPDDIGDLATVHLDALRMELHEHCIQLLHAEGIETSGWPDYTLENLEWWRLTLQIDVAIDHAMNVMAFAPIESAGTFLLSTAAGLLVESAVQGMNARDNQNSELGSVAGFGAGLATDFVASEAIGTRATLVEKTRSSVDLVLDSLTVGEGMISLNAVMNQIVLHEWTELCIRVASKYELTPEFVASTASQSSK